MSELSSSTDAPTETSSALPVNPEAPSTTPDASQALVKGLSSEAQEQVGQIGEQLKQSGVTPGTDNPPQQRAESEGGSQDAMAKAQDQASSIKDQFSAYLKDNVVGGGLPDVSSDLTGALPQASGDSGGGSDGDATLTDSSLTKGIPGQNTADQERHQAEVEEDSLGEALRPMPTPHVQGDGDLSR
jgi:hypothetical protein